MSRVLLILFTIFSFNSFSQTCNVSLTIQPSGWGHNFVDFTVDFDSTKIKDIYLETGDGDTVNVLSYRFNQCGTNKLCGYHEYFSLGSFEAIVTVIDSSNQICKDTVSINMECVASFDYTYDSSNTVYFINQSQPIDSLSFLWEPNYLVADTSQNLTFTYSSSGIVYPKLSVTTSNNKTCYIQDTVSINYCDIWWTMHGDTVDFSITTYTTELDSVYWSFGDGNSSNFFEKKLPSRASDNVRHSIKYAYSVDSSYQASVFTIDEFGNTCRDTVNFNYQPCLAGYSKTLDTLNNKVLLFNYSSEHQYSKYTYNFGDGSPEIVSSSKNLSHTYNQFGTYEVCITVNNWRCTDTYCDSVGLDSLGNLKSNGFTVEFVDTVVITSVEDAEQANTKLEGVVVYPNPSKNIFNVDLSKVDMQSKAVEIELYSTFGTLILKRKTNNQTEKIDLSYYAEGLYFLKLSLGDKISIEKLIKN